VVVVVGDREHRLEYRLQSDVFAPVGRDVLLEKRLVRPFLDLDQIRDLHDRRNLPEVLAAPTPALNRACHIVSRVQPFGRPQTVTSSLSSGGSAAAILLPRGRPRRGAEPHSDCSEGDEVPSERYLIETVAPCSSSFFFMSSASAL